MEDAFEIIAARVLSGEATEAEHARLQSLLAENDALRMEFTALEAAWATLRAAGPLVSSLNPPPAKIPPERLRQLRQAIRAQAATPKAPSVPELVRPLRLDFSAAPTPSLAWGWFQTRFGVSPTLVSFALLLLVGSVVFLINRPAKAPLPGHGGTSAYLLAGNGRVEVRRDGKRLAVSAVTALRAEDEIFFAPGAEAEIITPERWLRFEGPRTIATSELDGRAAAVQVQARLTAQSEALRLALFTPTSELRSAGLLVTTRTGLGIPLYSPLGSTASIAPAILWRADPGKTYDLRITDEFDSSTPSWTVEAVRPPINFSEVASWKDRPLARDGLYRLHISESGQPLTTSEYTFRTTADATSGSPAVGGDSVAIAVRILATTPSQVGDALNLLLRLSPEQMDTETALRLKLLIFGQRSYIEDFEAALAKIQSSSSIGR